MNVSVRVRGPIARLADALAFPHGHVDGNIESTPLHFAAPRPVIKRSSAVIVVDDASRMGFQTRYQIEFRSVGSIQHFGRITVRPFPGGMRDED